MIELGTKVPVTAYKPLSPESRANTAFGNAAVKTAVKVAAEEGVGKVAHAGVANWLEKAFTPLNRVKFNLGGMSLEDWAGRFLTVFGVYIPQAWISLRQNKHKWETNGRNILVWTMTLAVQMLSKHKKYGVNAIVDKFMQPPVEGQKAGALVEKFRLKGNYFNLLERAGLAVGSGDRGSAFWSTLDKNQLDVVETYRRNMGKLPLAEFEKFADNHDDVKKLVAEVKESTGKTGKELMQAAKEKFVVTENKFLRKVVNRMTAAKFLSTGIITIATMYLIGNLAMEIIFRTVARLDHDFDPAKLAKDKAKKKAIKEARKNEKKHGAPAAENNPQLARLSEPLPPAMPAMPFAPEAPSASQPAPQQTFAPPSFPSAMPFAPTASTLPVGPAPVFPQAMPLPPDSLTMAQNLAQSLGGPAQ